MSWLHFYILLAINIIRTSDFQENKKEIDIGKVTNTCRRTTGPFLTVIKGTHADLVGHVF